MVAVGMFLRTGHVEGSTLIHGLGTLFLSIGFLPWMIGRDWKQLNRFKRIERLLGTLGAIFLLNGILFKYMHWPGASIQITLGVFLFIFGYLPFSFHLGWREGGTRLKRTYEVFRFAALFIILLGFTFKVMHWPGAGIGLALGNLALPLFLLFYFILRYKGQGKLPFGLEDLLITIIAFTIWSFVNSSQVSKAAMGGYRLLEDQYIKYNAALGSSNRTIYQSISALSFEEGDPLRQSLGELEILGRECIGGLDSIRHEFYRILLGSQYRSDIPHLYLWNDLLANLDLPAEYFIIDGKGMEVKQLVNRYREGLLDMARQLNIPSGFLGEGLETKDEPAGYGETQDWVMYVFEAVPVGNIIVNLSLIKQMMLINELRALNALTSQMDLSEEALMIQELAARESERALGQKENEITLVRQQQELQELQLEQSRAATQQNRIMAIGAFAGVALVLVLFSISTRAYVRKQKDNKKLEEQKKEITAKNDELNQQNEEIAAQRDEIAAQRDEIEAQRDLVTDQKALIEKNHMELTSSIDYAMRLQTSILPGTELLEEAFSDHFILFRPRDRVSGDFYWWTKVEGQLVITVADCTGHGVPGAFMSMLGVSLLREIVDREYVSKPDVILQKLRREVIRSLSQKGEISEQKDGMDMALVSIDPRSLVCEYAGANNSLYLVRDGELREFRADRMPVSHYERMDRFSSHEIPLRKGDMLYLFSDGFADQFGGEQRKKFKTGNFKKLLNENAARSMKEQHRVLTDTIVSWQGPYEQVDDILVVGIRI